MRAPQPLRGGQLDWNSTANHSTGGVSQLRQFVPMPIDCKSPSFPFFIMLKNQGQLSTLGPPCGGSEQYFMGFSHIYTSTWFICHPWYVGRSINLCQCGLMLVLDLVLQFPFARWTKDKTHLEHVALPPSSSDVIIYLFLIIYVKETWLNDNTGLIYDLFWFHFHKLTNLSWPVLAGGGVSHLCLPVSLVSVSQQYSHWAFPSKGLMKT